MTVWFDTTDVWEWRELQLTGIQRVVATVLGFALRMQDDVRLFRFDRAARRLVQLHASDLPAALRRYGAIHDDPSSGPITSRLGWLSRAGRRLGVLPKHAGPIPVGIEGPEPSIGRGDVILSLSLTWGYEGYWEAIAACRSRGTRFVQLVHDVAPITHPHWLPPEWRTMATAWFDGVARHADLILTVSLFQQCEIETLLRSAGLRSPPVRAVRLGDDPPLMTVPDPSLSGGNGPADGIPFVLCVSGFYPRKNHEALHQAWRGLVAALGAACPALVLVGPAPIVAPHILAAIVGDPLLHGRIRVLHDVNDEALGRLYRTCLFTVYPSFYEGWGLPVAESLAFGRYCIASSAGPLPEIGGDLIDYIDPADTGGLLEALLHAIRDPAYVARKEGVIRARYRRHAWSDTAAEILGQALTPAAGSS